MANLSDKADEVVGRAKQAAGDLTGNDELRAEGTVDEVKAQVKQGVSDTAEQLHLDDKRVLVIAAIAGLTLTLLVRNVRGRNDDRRAATKRATKRAAKTGLGRALTS